jgi:hypothetical protein
MTSLLIWLLLDLAGTPLRPRGLWCLFAMLRFLFHIKAQAEFSPRYRIRVTFPSTPRHFAGLC